MKMRLLLGDQLNIEHSWFKKTEDDVRYVQMEMRQETDYAPHHIQKVVAFFGAMRNFEKEIRQKGHHTTYLTLDDPENKQHLTENLNQLIKKHKITSFEYQEPDEYRLDKQIADFCQSLSIPFQMVSSEHFMTSRKALSTFFEGKKQYIMEFFYRDMRKKFDLLMQDQQPEG